MFLPHRDCDLQVDSLDDDGVGGAIKELESYWWDQICMDFIFGGKASLNETVS